MLFFVVSGEKVKPVSACGKHLRDSIFVEHALVYRKLVVHDLLVQRIPCNCVFVESMREQESGIAHVALDGGIVAVQAHARIGVGTLQAVVGNHGVSEPHKGVLVGVLGIDAGFDFGERYALLMLGKERRYLQECGKDL